MSDALMKGMIFGALMSKGDEGGDEKFWEERAAALKVSLEKRNEDYIEKAAEVCGYHDLVVGMIAELKNPQMPRRLSDPDNSDARRSHLRDKTAEFRIVVREKVKSKAK